MRNNLYTTLLAVAYFIATAFTAQSTNTNGLAFKWSKVYGGNSTFQQVISTAVDGAGNYYMMGWFYGIMDADPGSQVHNIVSNGQRDVFVIKTDSNGNYIWGHSFGGLTNDHAYAMALDAQANIYLTGCMRWTVDFNPDVNQTDILKANCGEADIFLLKLDSAGNERWAHKCGQYLKEDKGICLTVDAQNNIVLAGHFIGNTDFDFSPSLITNLSSYSSDGDVFVAKYDTGAHLIWADQFGGANAHITLQSLVCDPSNAIYFAGSFKGAIDADPTASSTTLQTASSHAEAYIIKLNANGQYIWHQQQATASQSAEYSSLCYVNSGLLFVAKNIGTNTIQDPRNWYEELLCGNTSVSILNASTGSIMHQNISSHNSTYGIDAKPVNSNSVIMLRIPATNYYGNGNDIMQVDTSGTVKMYYSFYANKSAFNSLCFRNNEVILAGHLKSLDFDLTKTLSSVYTNAKNYYACFAKYKFCTLPIIHIFPYSDTVWMSNPFTLKADRVVKWYSNSNLNSQAILSIDSMYQATIYQLTTNTYYVRDVGCPADLTTAANVTAITKPALTIKATWDTVIYLKSTYWPQPNTVKWYYKAKTDIVFHLVKVGTNLTTDSLLYNKIGEGDFYATLTEANGTVSTSNLTALFHKQFNSLIIQFNWLDKTIKVLYPSVYADYTWYKIATAKDTGSVIGTWIKCGKGPTMHVYDNSKYKVVDTALVLYPTTAESIVEDLFYIMCPIPEVPKISVDYDKNLATITNADQEMTYVWTFYSFNQKDSIILVYYYSNSAPIPDNQFYLRVKATNKCQKSIISSKYKVDVRKSITKDQLRYSPNPITDELQVTTPYYCIYDELVLMNEIGVELESKPTSEGFVVFDMRNYPKGVYFVAPRQNGILAAMHRVIKL